MSYTIQSSEKLRKSGADMETKPAMLRFEENDPETTIVYDRSKDGGNE